jgi:hypothetical protein
MVCGGVLEYQEPSPLGLIDLFGSVDAFQRVLSCDSVEVVELKPSADYFTPAPEYGDRRVKLPVADAVALRAVLCTDKSFDWRSLQRPESRANFRVKFEKDGHAISLDLFLSARCVRLVTGQEAHGAVSFEFGYPVAAEIIERHFPGALPKG